MIFEHAMLQFFCYMGLLQNSFFGMTHESSGWLAPFGQTDRNDFCTGLKWTKAHNTTYKR
ncbi:hypothetical protein MIDIC_410018 [Alphaproteobacteria bacterium]